MLRLDELTQGEFDEWFALSTKQQIADRIWATGGSRDVVTAAVEAMVPQLLPQGRHTPGHTFRLARDVDGRVVAFVWFGVLPGLPDSQRFLFDIHVIPAARRCGYGRDVLGTMIDQLAKEGVHAISLNVLENNDAAIALYKSLGFTLEDQGDDAKHLEMSIRL